MFYTFFRKCVSCTIHALSIQYLFSILAVGIPKIFRFGLLAKCFKSDLFFLSIFTQNPIVIQIRIFKNDIIFSIAKSGFYRTYFSTSLYSKSRRWSNPDLKATLFFQRVSTLWRNGKIKYDRRERNLRLTSFSRKLWSWIPYH